MSEKQKYNIQLNRKKLSAEEINEHADFGKIYKKHKLLTKRPIYKRKRVYFILFLILFIAYILYLQDKKEKGSSKKTNPKIIIKEAN